MKTFIESIQLTTNLKMMKEAFILMSQHGINPNDFVEWYTTDGIVMQDQGLLLESSENWLSESFHNPRRYFPPRPMPPAPTPATINRSLGAMKPFPPNTWRGTIINPAAARDAVLTKSLLELVFSFI
jgi:hypothetical protein